jgi:hypothetical protein
MTRSVAVAAALLALLAPAASGAEFTGGIHGHSAYSDGYVGSRPADVLASAKGHGNDFFAVTDHSDTLQLPISASEECIAGIPPIGCAIADQVHPVDSFRKWAATKEQAQAATTGSFTGIRGFEWTSDRFGHINVLGSTNQTNAKVDGGYADLDLFYLWLNRLPRLDGGGDGLATFNHPGDKKLSTDDPAYNWDDFAYHPAVDDQMVGIEVYNSASDFGSPHEHGSGDDGWYAHALDRGWHVGAIGAEDLGHKRGDDWGGPGQAKTVILAANRSWASLRAALVARRFYAVRTPGYHLGFTVDGAHMGSRLARPPGRIVTVHGTATGPDAQPLELDLITHRGAVVASGTGTLDVTHRVAPGERWLFLRARRADGTAVAYSSPVWL